MSDENNYTGMIGMGAAISYFSDNKWVPFTPSNDILPYDFVIGNCEETKRVQVKATKAKNPSISLVVRSRNAQGNVLKKTPTSAYDILFAVWIHEDGVKDLYSFPSDVLEGRSSVGLDSKWALKWKVSTHSQLTNIFCSFK